MTHNIPQPEIKAPSRATLRKYGLTETEWLGILERQGNVCPICHKLKTSMVTDHVHYANWKKLPADVRKSYVRGVICNYCNRWVVGKGMTAELLDSGAKYLRDYTERRELSNER